MHDLIDRLRRAALRAPDSGPSDGELLELFLAHRDEVAFEALVRRHGPMVLGVCRRLLQHTQDAEDAFQATFLVLVRKAPTILPRERVGDWLYGVARQTARKANANRARLRTRERPAEGAPEPGSPTEPPLSDLDVQLERELAALPETYRVVLLLCDRDGLTRAEAAAQLGWPEGTVSSRLARGRELLARRLGHGQPAGVVVPAGLVLTTTQAASALAAGTATAGAISAPVVALMEGVLQAMVPLKLKFVAAVALTVGLFGFALGAGQGLLQGPKSAPAADAPSSPPAVRADVEEVHSVLRFAQQLDEFQVEPTTTLRYLPLRTLRSDTVVPVEVYGYTTRTPATIPPELLRLLVNENDPERRKLLGQLIEAYQRAPAPTASYGYVTWAYRKAATPPSEKEVALQKVEDAIQKLRAAAKDRASEAALYDALLQDLKKRQESAPPK